MFKVSLTIAIAFIVCVYSSSAQTSYSESIPFKFEPQTDRKKKKEKKKEKENAAPPPAVTASPTPLSGDETVVIPFSVFDNSGAFVKGLTKSEVTIFVDETELPIGPFGTLPESPNVLLLLDTSPSAISRLKAMKQDAISLIERLRPNTKIMVLDFNFRTTIRSSPTTDRNEAIKAINSLVDGRAGDGTSIYEAVAVISTGVVPQLAGQSVVVILSDGIDTTSQKATHESSLFEVQKTGAIFYPVFYDTSLDARNKPNPSIPPEILEALKRSGIRMGLSEVEYRHGESYLSDLARASGGRMFRSQKFDASLKSFVEELSAKYYAAVTVSKRGAESRQIKVRIARPGLTVVARGSFVER